jgi:hypothetical protein
MTLPSCTQARCGSRPGRAALTAATALGLGALGIVSPSGQASRLKNRPTRNPAPSQRRLGVVLVEQPAQVVVAVGHQVVERCVDCATEVPPQGEGKSSAAQHTLPCLEPCALNLNTLRVLVSLPHVHVAVHRPRWIWQSGPQRSRRAFLPKRCTSSYSERSRDALAGGRLQSLEPLPAAVPTRSCVRVVGSAIQRRLDSDRRSESFAGPSPRPARAGTRLATAPRRPEPLLLEERQVATRARTARPRPARLLGAPRLPQRCHYWREERYSF